MANKNSGYLVEVVKGDNTGKRGRTYHTNGRINGKIPVYLENEKFKFSEKAILFDPEKLKIVGFID